MANIKLNFSVLWGIGLLLLLKVISISAQSSRLPSTIIPVKYTLNLNTDLYEDNFSFWGSVTIEIKCIETTKEIRLHSKELNINELILQTIADIPKTITLQLNDNENENDFIIITTNEDLIPDSHYLLLIRYRGQLRDDSQGYYRNSYTDENGNTKWMAVTMFLPNNARYGLPCFDEPLFKAPFIIKLSHAPHLKALSNMPLDKSEPSLEGNNWVMDTFEESPALSTYMIAFALSELEISILATDDASSVTVATLERKQFSDQVEFAQMVSNEALIFFSKYFAFDYPLSKLDVGIIPGYPIAGMESFGFVNVGESPTLVSLQSSSIYNKYDAATLICITITNLWLGDIVTVKWWDELWLVEAFGDYFQIIAIDNIKPDWKAADLSFMRKFLNAIELDSLITSHPISIPINDPKEINSLYDDITYEKGSYLIRMLHSFLGNCVFEQSIAAYLQNYQYSNATPDNLWSIMSENAYANKLIPDNLTIKAIMESWILQAGYPLLNVKRDYQAKKITITQERFFNALDSESIDANLKNGCWILPITFTTGKELNFTPTTKFWLTCDGPLNFEIDIEATDWIIFNIRMEVLCQVYYDDNNWTNIQKALTNEIEFAKIEVLSRVQIITDIFSFAWIATLPYKMALNTIQYLNFEPEYLPWRKGLRALAELRVLLLRTNIFEVFQEYVRTILEPRFLQFGRIIDLSPDEFLSTHFKTYFVFMACTYSIEDCQKQSQEIFDEWMKNPQPDQNNPIPNDVRTTVYCQAAQLEDVKYWNFLYDRYYNSNIPNELSEISAALACSLDVEILERYLNWSLDGEKIRKEESAWVFSNVCDNDIAFNLVKTFLESRFAEIYQYHNGDTNALTTYISSFATLIMTEEELTDFQNFVNSIEEQLINVQGAVTSSTEKAKNNIGWHKLHFNEIFEFFNS